MGRITFFPLGDGAVLLSNDSVLVAGNDGADGLATSEIYDPESETWTEPVAMNDRHCSAPVVLLDDGRPMIVSGLDCSGPFPTTLLTAEVYTPEDVCLMLPSGLNSCDLQKGDILLLHEFDGIFLIEASAFAGYWTHAGVYNGDGTVTESFPEGVFPVETPGVQVLSLQESSWGKDIRNWAILRVPTADGTKRQDAVTYAKAQESKPYNWIFPDKETELKFYCSQLMWRAFFQQPQSIDLDSNLSGLKALVWAGPWGVAAGPAVLSAVPPDDIYLSPNAEVIKQLKSSAWVFRLGSPADFLITDPQGRRTGLDPLTGAMLQEIPDAFYSGPSGEPEFMSLEEVVGTWRIDVIGLGQGTYTFQAESVDQDNHFVISDSSTITQGAVATYQLSTSGIDGQPPVLTRIVGVDIKPGEIPNSINLRSRGNIPVAILSTDTFDATTVDPLSVQFGPSGASESHNRGHIEDANGDGKLDMVLHFRTQETGINAGDTQACLTGKTTSDVEIQGCDTIRTIPAS